jgi:hypothetical protein
VRNLKIEIYTSKSQHNENSKQKAHPSVMHEQHTSKCPPSLHSLRTPNEDICLTIQSYERNQKKTQLGLQNKTTDRTLLGYTTDNMPLDRKSRGLANRIFLDAEGYD